MFSSNDTPASQGAYDEQTPVERNVRRQEQPFTSNEGSWSEQNSESKAAIELVRR